MAANEIVEKTYYYKESIIRRKVLSKESTIWTQVKQEGKYDKK